ncbi:MAG: transposase [Planctomycetaceae bacterium]
MAGTMVLRGLADEQSMSTWMQRSTCVFERLDESERRWVAGLMAGLIGHGGVSLVSRLVGLDPKTIQTGRREVCDELATCPENRVRRPGAGRPPLEKKSLL